MSPSAGKPNIRQVFATLNLSVQGPIRQRHFGHTYAYAFMKTPSSKNIPSDEDSDGKRSELDAQRIAIRQQRAELSEFKREELSLKICNQAKQTHFYLQATRIALYLANQGEVETRNLIEHALSSDKQVYLPVLDSSDKTRMYFVRYQAGDHLVENRFGLLEPELKEENVIEAKQLDLVLCPLVAFDEDAHRVGMGGGFYDRHFAFKNQMDVQAQPPILVGLAYDFQKVASIHPAPWDVAMSAVISETSIYLPPKN